MGHRRGVGTRDISLQFMSISGSKVKEICEVPGKRVEGR